MPANRLLPLIVAIALFMENMDSTIIATSLPTIANDIGANPLALKLAVTSYLLSLAVFIPVSGWMADRFGTRTVFRGAIATFVLGSIGCAISGSLTDFVIARIVQGIGGVAFGFSIAGLNFLPWTISAWLIVIGTAAIIGYIFHARRAENPVIDLTLFRIPTFRASVVGGFMFRIGVGALAFLLPLMLQLGFHFTPLQSGLITFATAIGAMSMKLGVASILKRIGFRNVLVANAVISSVFLGACALFTANTPLAVMFVILLIGGFFRSLEFTCINTIAYADVEPARAGHATSLTSVAQQLSVSTGVAVGALLVETSVRMKAEPAITADDFPLAFLIVAAISTASTLVFLMLPKDAGAEMANRLPATEAEPEDQKLN